MLELWAEVGAMKSQMSTLEGAFEGESWPYSCNNPHGELLLQL